MGGIRFLRADDSIKYNSKNLTNNSLWELDFKNFDINKICFRVKKGIFC